MRSSHDGLAKWLTLLMLTSILLPLAPVASADASSPADLQAQNAAAMFSQSTESTTVFFDNIQTTNGTLWQMLQNTRYLVYRSPVELNASMIENSSLPNGDELLPFANISACPGSLSSCSGKPHSVEYPLPPGVNGTFYYGIVTMLENGEIRAFLELGVAQTGQPVSEFTNDITAPFTVTATFDPETSRTTVQWINLNELQPGTLPEVGPFAYTINVYRHLNPANRTSWPMLEKELLSGPNGLPAGTNTYIHDVMPMTDEEAYYSVTYLYNNYEDRRFLGTNTLNPELPVSEDNVPPGLLTGAVIASFVPEPDGGTGNTTIEWSDNLTEIGETYYVWRSGNPFNDTSHPDVELIAEVLEDYEEYRYQVERGTLGHAYYAVTVADARGNHNSFIGNSSIVMAGPVMENAFDPWIAEPTNVQAEYLGGGWTNVTWTDQLGAEGEFYNVWHSWTKLSAASNLTLEATLVATVPDGISYALVPVPPEEDRLSYYAVTTVARYNHLNATYEDTRFIQNKIQLPVHEDTQAPAPVQLAQPMLQGTQKTVLLSWINTLSEENETYTIYRHLGDPFNGGEVGGKISDDSNWEVMLDNIDPGIDTTVLREVYLPANLDRDVWYALSITDSWGNIRESLANRSNVWLVREDTTPPECIATIDDLENAALRADDHRLSITVTEELAEAPMIVVTTSDFDAELGTGTSFTPVGEVTRAQSFMGSTTRFIWDFPISQGLDTGGLVVQVSLIDSVGNSQNLEFENWTIDAQKPAIELFSPSTASKYLYGDNIRIHGVVTDDVGLLEVKFRMIGNPYSFYPIVSEWELVTDVTPSDAENNTLVFDMREPSATFEDPGNHRLEIMATDFAGNEHVYQTTFFVDHCYENITGITHCASGGDPINPEEQEPEAAPTLSSPPYVFIIALVSFNVLLLLFAVMMGILAAQDPRKKGRGEDDEFDEGDDWMMEFMGGSGGSGSAEDVRSDLGTLDSAPEQDLSKSKALVDDDDDIFSTPKPEKRKKKKKSSKKKKKVEVEEEEDDDDDDDDDWGDDDDDEEPKKKPKKRKPARRAVKRRK